MNQKKERDILRQMIIAECYRIAYLLKKGADENIYIGWGDTFEGHSATELFSRMKDLRRNSIYLEKMARGKLEAVK